MSHRGSWGRVLTGFAVIVILGGMFPGNGLAAGSPVTVAKTSTGVQLLLVDLAAQMGFFAKRGVDAKITIVRGDAESIPALVSGSVQFSVMTSTPALIAMAKGAGIQMIASLSTYPEQIVMRKALADRLGITSSTPLAAKLQALRGRTVAILDVGGGLQYTLQAVLASYGIDPKSVPVVAMSPYTAQLAALQRGAIDVIAPAIPYGQVAVAGGYGVMIADVWGGEVPSLRGQPFEVMSVETNWAKTHSSVVQGVKEALQDAATYLHSNPAAAVQIAHQLQPNIPVEVLTDIIGTGAGYPTSVTITRNQFDAMQSFAKLSGAATGMVSFARAVWSPSSP